MSVAVDEGRARRSAAGDRHRALLVLALFVALAILHTWPLAQAPGVFSRNDNADTVLNEWALAWIAHQLPRDPLNLFNANIFYPEPNTLAFSEHLFVQALMGAPLFWLGASPVVVHNLLVIAGFALTGWSMWLVVHRWTGDMTAALAAGSLMAFNAHTLTRVAHLQAMHVEFLPLAVLALDRLFAEPRLRAGWWLALFFTLQALTSNYLFVATSFAMVAAALARPADWAPRFRRVLPPLALGTAVAAGVMIPFLLPYYQAHQQQGLTRSLGEVTQFSASWRDYFTTGGRLHFALWSDRFWASGARTPLFPGVAASALAAVAIATGFSDARVRMWLAIGAAGVWLSFGTAAPGYARLYDAFPLLKGIRAPVRLGYLALVATAALAGFGVAFLRRRWSGRPWLPVFSVAVLLLVTLEAWRAPVGYTLATPLDPIYETLAAERHAVIAEFPFHRPEVFFRNADYMLSSTRHWKPILNGYSGFLPTSYRRHWEELRGFPDAASLVALRRIGVTHVIVHGSELLAQARQVRALQEINASRDITIFRVRWERIGRAEPAPLASR